MPGPFPGVDPYLEQPTYWRGFHNLLIGALTRELNAVLPPEFAANFEERVYVLPEERAIIPDVSVHKRAPQRPQQGQTATATIARDAGAPHGTVIAFPEEQREGFVEILTVEAPRRVVTVVEVLSPANKAQGTGRTEYLRKQRELLSSDTNLIEIDLLRGGEHTVAAPLDALRRRAGATWDALICLHRPANRYHYDYWLTPLTEPLASFRVPLAGVAPDVVLDLQVLYDQTYDAGPYHRMVDYAADAPLPLPQELAEWADALLREKGVRP